jgi:hypothetical protein
MAFEFRHETDGINQGVDMLSSNSLGAGSALQITYPSYKSLDPFIDLQWLKSLDGYLTEKLSAKLAGGKSDLFLNQYRLDPNTPHQPGAREIWLTRTAPGTPYNYLDLDKTALWQRTAEAAEFALLMDFIETLPFKATGRILIIFDDGGSEVPAHRDHLQTETCHEFIWFRTNLKKPFYMYAPATGEKIYVRSHSAWFDTVNQFHGSDAAPGLAFSIRVDGIFNDTFRKQIPAHSGNAAATAAIWATLNEREENH